MAKGPRAGAARVKGPGGRTAGAVRAPRAGSRAAAGKRYRADTVDRLPAKYNRLKYHDRSYYSWGGRYYRPYWYGGHVRYAGIYPPVGLWIPALPRGYSTDYYDGGDYYYYNDVYYTDSVQDGTAGYVIAEPPPVTGEEEEVAPAGPDPFDVLKKMSDHLGGAKCVSVVAETTMDKQSDTGQQVQLSAHRKIRMSRPSEALTEVKGDDIDRKLIYDGKTVTMYDHGKNVYGVVDAPGTIDATLDYLIQDYGMTIPLGDFLYSSPYDALLPATQTGYYLGLTNIGDVICDHLAFEGDAVDWQLWVEANEKPLPRKFMITYKLAGNNPKYTATLKEWDLSANLPPKLFEFIPPAGAERIEILPVSEREGAKDGAPEGTSAPERTES